MKINKKHDKFTVVAVSMIVFLAICFLVQVQYNDHTYVVTVTDKESVVTSGKKATSRYLIFADDENGQSMVFENTDAYMRGKWNSSDMQGKLKENHTYEITVVGYRVQLLSMYENIISVKEIDSTN